MDLPQTISTLLEPLFSACPPDRAMQQLVVRQPAAAGVTDLVERLVKEAGDRLQAPLCSALWLYVDNLDRSHTISQGMQSATGSFWHGIMHRREGDFSNSHYWFDKVGTHPAMSRISGYDAHDFIDAVESDDGGRSAQLVALQLAEWQALFAWCAENPS